MRLAAPGRLRRIRGSATFGLPACRWRAMPSARPCRPIRCYPDNGRRRVLQHQYDIHRRQVDLGRDARIRPRARTRSEPRVNHVQRFHWTESARGHGYSRDSSSTAYTLSIRLRRRGVTRALVERPTSTSRRISKVKPHWPRLARSLTRRHRHLPVREPGDLFGSHHDSTARPPASAWSPCA